ncbi:MAG TPA: hypothetical protein VGG37_02285 [Opitutaceae bacterium]|jgi:hypothetical protein
MNLTRIALFTLAAGAAPFAAQAGLDIGINLGGPEVVVRSAPPPERHEVIPVSPGPGYVWIHGHWGWHRDRWEWMGGRWDRPAQPGSVWIAGQWVPRGGGYVWVEGHYNVQAAPPPGPVVEGEMYADEAPPAPIYEAVPASPGPEFFWIGGHWQWNGRWVWTHGRYARHPHFHPGGSWEAGRWDRHNGRYVWHEGHWR